MRDFKGSSLVDFLRVFGFGLDFIFAPCYEKLSSIYDRKSNLPRNHAQPT